MKVVVANTAGFCKGVRDAIEVTMEAIQKREDGEDICTFGPLIHNRQVLAMLQKRGVSEENAIARCSGKKVVIRAHGIPPQTRQSLHATGATLLDATCKRVAKVHAAIKRHARRGYHTIIVGDADHAEVIGLMGYTGARGVVINRPEQLDRLPSDWDKVLLVAQTTQNEEVFKAIEVLFRKKYPGGTVKNTICDSTHERQNEVRELCSSVEAMVIVGGLHSGNTVRLAEVAMDCAIPTYHVETEAELDREEMARYMRVGVSAGASTPNWIIKNVVEFLEAIAPEAPKSRFPWKRIVQFLAYSNLCVAFGGALLPAIAWALTGVRIPAALSAMAAGYVFAMHSLNIYLDRDSIMLNDPRRAAFYAKWRALMAGSSVVAVIAALAIALLFGAATFFAMVVLTMLGIVYAVPFILPAWREMLPVKLKDIPTSKTFAIPFAWASAGVLAPHLSGLGASFGQVCYAFLAVFLLALARTTLLDFLAVQGDRLVGKETLVVLAGEKRTAFFAAGVLAALVLLLLLGRAAGLGSNFAFLMVPAACVYGCYLMFGIRKRLHEDPLFETLTEAVIIGTGVLALAWNLAA